jgi:hypothetical protein
METDEDQIECATCFLLQEAINNLDKICYYIELSNPKGNVDFGLQKSYLKTQIKNIQKAQNWHEYYHATGRSLSETQTDVSSKRRRWRPS